MFDFHIHSRVSFDSDADPAEIVNAAIKAGMREICFTDHLDYDPMNDNPSLAFSSEIYADAYDRLCSADVKIRRGMEFGMLPDNYSTMEEDLQRRPFDFVIGSVHFADGMDIYYPPFWEGKTIEVAERQVLEQTLECVRVHDGFDVLGHLTYISKADANPVKRVVPYDAHRECVDEIFRQLIQKGKGIEINTSGIDICGEPLPGLGYLHRFKELGGEIVTVGSDAHTVSRVGQYCTEICEAVKEVFGYVCTFENRKPIFHKL